MKMKILIVDDKEENLYLLESLLTGNGYKVISVGNGKEALESAITNPPDLIISDILMPVMDGFTLCKKWKANKILKTIPFIFYTATYTDTKDEEFALHLGADTFITKPQDPDLFIVTIKNVLDKLKTGKYTPPSKPEIDEVIQVREYNQALIRKLEDKMVQVEEMNKQMSKILNRYKSFLHTAPDAIFILDERGFIVESNNQACKLFGYNADEIIKVLPHHLHIEEDRENVIATMEAVRNGKIEKNDWKFKRKDGSFFYGHLRAIFNPETGFQVVIRDLTDRKIAEDKVKQLNYQLLKAGEIANFGFLDWDLISNEIDLSFQVKKIYGIPENVSDVKEFIDNAVHPQDVNYVNENLNLAINDSKEFDIDYRIIRPDGIVLWINARAELFKDEHGKPIRLLETILEITDRKQIEDKILKINEELERQVKQRTIMLEAAIKDLESFSYSVSHDLRAPLRAIDGFSNVLLEEYSGKLDQEGKRLLQVILQGAKNMGHLIDDLLAFSKIGQQDLSKSIIEMKPLAKYVFHEIASEKERARISFSIADIPDADGDKHMIEQIWRNLISNAVKYTSKTETPVIEIGSKKEKGTDVYFIRDNGVGFDMKYYTKVFGVFQRLHSVKEYEGTGVGLAIVNTIVAKHGGRIWAESKPGEGSVFYFSLASQR
ncbi:MAG: PAS domain S-box protein [Bacteroidales bacterium]|nr:PAS domain S-box protein [Bacteroidales bacterium]